MYNIFSLLKNVLTYWLFLAEKVILENVVLTFSVCMFNETYIWALNTYKEEIF